MASSLYRLYFTLFSPTVLVGVWFPEAYFKPYHIKWCLILLINIQTFDVMGFK
jgi:hypothetical protein